MLCSKIYIYIYSIIRGYVHVYRKNELICISRIKCVSLYTIYLYYSVSQLLYNSSKTLKKNYAHCCCFFLLYFTLRKSLSFSLSLSYDGTVVSLQFYLESVAVFVLCILSSIFTIQPIMCNTYKLFQCKKVSIKFLVRYNNVFYWLIFISVIASHFTIRCFLSSPLLLS